MLVGLAAMVATVFAVPAMAAYPDKPVTVICPWTAGGGTDVLLRSLSKSAEKYLGQTISVVNQTGGAGAIGHNAIRAARPDGYTVGMITFELNSLPPQGLVPFTWKDFDPLMRINSDPAALTVRADAPYSTVRGFMDLAMRGDIEDLQMEQLTISTESPVAGKDLISSQLRQRFNIIVIGIKKPDGKLLFNPQPQVILEAGDTLILVGGKQNLAAMQREIA